MEKNLLDTLIEKTLQYLTEFKEEHPYVMGTSYEINSHEEKPSSIQKAPTFPYPVKKPVISETPLPKPSLIEKLPMEPVPMEQVSVKLEAKVERIPVEFIPSKKIAEASPSASFPLYPPSPAHKDLMQDIRTILKKVAPSLTLSNSIPSDEKAKKIKNAWREHAKIPDIALLVTESSSLSFLKQVAKAIELHFFPSKVIDVKLFEQNNNWDTFLNTANLKMIIAPDSVIWSCKHLMRYYHEFPNKKERYLGKIPLLLLPDPSLYIKDPSLKRSLWNLLCQVLKSLQR